MRKSKIWALLISAVLAAGTLAGCGGSSAPAQEAQEETAEAETEETTGESTEDSASEKNVSPSNTVKGEPAEDEGDSGSAAIGTAGEPSDVVLENVSYVMIYNPKIYDEYDSNTEYLTNLGTGDISSQIITGMNRAGGLEEDVSVVTMSQAELTSGLDTNGVDRSGARAGAMDPVHSYGEQYDFYCCDDNMSRVKRTFTCVYEGESCYIWSFEDSISEENAEAFGQEFDEKIYPADTEAFGQGRFTENGGKVNVLIYPLRDGLCGFFHLYDIFAKTEVPAAMIDQRGFNTDHAIININSKMVDSDWEMALSTLAHEYQHQICASDCFNYVDTPWMRVWLNEAMSAYAEDMIYPDIMDAGYYNQLLYISNSFRTGQSLYNFATQPDDIGAYGAVCLFERYLTSKSDDTVFNKIHEYWRNSYRADVTEAEAIYDSVTDTFKQDILSKYTYPASVEAQFESEQDSFMSKMTLDYYLETMNMDLAHLVGSEAAARKYMLYTEINQQEIEGGGRMLVAVGNGSFAVPADADKGLIYIGFDKDFNIVTDMVTVE